MSSASVTRGENDGGQEAGGEDGHRLDGDGAGGQPASDDTHGDDGQEQEDDRDGPGDGGVEGHQGHGDDEDAHRAQADRGERTPGAEPRPLDGGRQRRRGDHATPAEAATGRRSAVTVGRRVSGRAGGASAICRR